MEIVNYIYGYGRRKGQDCPITTIAVVKDVQEDGKINLGIGLSLCSKKDNPEKAKGRRIALARARGVIHNKSIIHTKRSEEFDTSSEHIIGLYLRPYEGYKIENIIENFLLNDDLHSRLVKCCDFLLANKSQKSDE